MDSNFIEHKHNNLMKYQTLIRTTAMLYLLMAVLGCTSTKEAEEGFLQVDKKVISVAKTATETRFTVSSTERWQLKQAQHRGGVDYQHSSRQRNQQCLFHYRRKRRIHYHHDHSQSK